MPTLRTVTLGCRVNQYETEYVRQGLERVGFADAADGEPADLCIVNTCTVTHEGDAKSRQTIRQLAKRNPAARIVVMGCYATRAPDEVAGLPGVVEVLTDKRELPDLLQRHGVVDIPTGIDRFPARQRAYVKVQDGCMLSCTFCIIPSVRPGLQSRPLEHLVDEVQKLVKHGHREIVLPPPIIPVSSGFVPVSSGLAVLYVLAFLLRASASCDAQAPMLFAPYLIASGLVAMKCF